MIYYISKFLKISYGKTKYHEINFVRCLIINFNLYNVLIGNFLLNDYYKFYFIELIIKNLFLYNLSPKNIFIFIARVL